MKFLLLILLTISAEIERIAWYGGKIKERIRKDGVIFDTFEEAKEALLLNANIRISQAEIDLQRAKDKLEKIEAINEPENVDVA